MDLDLPVPDHTTLSRRSKGHKKLKGKFSKRASLDIVVDSTGLGIYGPGEWLAERQGAKIGGNGASCTTA